MPPKYSSFLNEFLGPNTGISAPVPPAPVAAHPPILQIPIAPIWDPVKGSEFLITSGEMIKLTGSFKFDHEAMQTLMEKN